MPSIQQSSLTSRAEVPQDAVQEADATSRSVSPQDVKPGANSGAARPILARSFLRMAIVVCVPGFG
jgi:hypothetical protein